MAHINIFENDAFSAAELTAALERVPHRPTLLGSLNLFEEHPIRTEVVGIEERAGKLELIQTSERGAPLEQASRDKRQLRYFNTVRLAKSDTLYAHELQNIRAFGNESELMQVAKESARRLKKLNDSLELTLEKHRLGAVQGILLDADDSPIRNWFTEFGISQPAEIDFALGAGATDVRLKCHEVTRAMARASQGAWIDGVTQVHALVGDGFFDALISHKSVKETWLNWSAANELRQGNAFGSFHFGGITFHNLRGTDDGSLAIGSDKAHFFPVGAPGVFIVARSPAETFDFVNTPGQRAYAMVLPDRERNASVKHEVYSYPLHICTTPGMLQRAKLA